jgi:ABC-type branched-subunit amino acid transport system substrate-binding protein
MRSRHLGAIAIVTLLACLAGQAPAQPVRRPAAPSGSAPRPAAPSGPVLRLGALLPLNGPGAWFGAEIKQGLELAGAELDSGSPRSTSTTDGSAADSEGRPSSEATPKASPESKPPTPAPAGESGPSAAAPDAGEPKTGPARTATEPIEPRDRQRTLSLVIQAVDVQPLDVRDAEAEAQRLLGSGVSAILTTSPTPALAVYPLASARDVLVLHAGIATERFPATSRMLIQLRPAPGVRADVLGAYAWERGIRRLAVVAGGDGFGRAVRTAVAARWRKQGGQLTHEESVSLEGSDLRSRFRAAMRSGPEAVVLGFERTALGEAARSLRDTGYTGLILAVDDDRAAILAAGRALDGAMLLSDAFVPVPGTRGARFARAYEARHNHPPSRFAASAYEVAILLAEAAERSVAAGRGLTATRLRDVLATGGPFPSLYAGDLELRDDGTLGRPLALFRVHGERPAFEGYVGLDGRVLAKPAPATP